MLRRTIWTQDRPDHYLDRQCRVCSTSVDRPLAIGTGSGTFLEIRPARDDPWIPEEVFADEPWKLPKEQAMRQVLAMLRDFAVFVVLGGFFCWQWFRGRWPM